jgi:MFS family permease
MKEKQTKKQTVSFPLAIASYLIASAFLVFEMGIQTSFNVMNHQLMQAVNISTATLSLISAAYFITYTFMQIPAGLLFDRFNTKTMVTSAILICTAGIFLFASVHLIPSMILGRLLMGLGSACAFIGVLVVASKWFSARYFSFLVGLAQLLAAIGAAMGEAPLSALIHNQPWDKVMLNIAFLGLAIAALAFLIIPRHKKQQDRAQHSESTSPFHSMMHNLGTIACKPNNLWIALYACLNWAPVLILAELSGVIFLESRGFSASESSNLINFIWYGIMITSPLIGFLAARYPMRIPLTRLCALMGVLGSLLAIYSPEQSYLTLAICMLLIGVASSGQILTFGLIKDQNPAQMTGTAVAFNNMAVVAGGLIFQPLVGLILHYTLPFHSPDQTAHLLSPYQWAFMFIPCAYIGCYLISACQFREIDAQTKKV